MVALREATRYFLLKLHFQRIFYVFVFAALLLLLGSLSLRAFDIAPQERMVKDLTLSCIGLFGFLMTTVMGISLLHDELESKQIYLFLSRPLSPVGYLWGILLAIMIWVTSGLVVLYGEVGALLWALTGSFPLPLLQNFLAHVAEAFLWANLTLLLSLLVTPNLNFCLSSAVFIAARIPLEYIQTLLWDENRPLALVLSLLKGFLPELGFLNLKIATLQNQLLSPAVLLGVVLYALGYSLCLLFLTKTLLSRRNL